MEEIKLTTRMVRDWNQISQRGCEISIPRDTHKLPRHGTEHPALADPSWAEVGLEVTSKFSYFCGSLMSADSLMSAS